MNTHSLTVIIRALNEHKIKYLIAGGLAVVAHGFVRFTADIDIILEMSESNLKDAMDIFHSLGFIPRAPVPIESFADAQERNRWIQEKGLTVFSLWSREHPLAEVDLFVSDPVGFDAAYGRAARFALEPNLEATFLSLEDLIATKKVAGRFKDRDDIENLLQIHAGEVSDDKPGE